MFAKVRSGQVRVLMGSTQKMGAGTNVQDRLIALHDLDCPWWPSDVGQVLRTGCLYAAILLSQKKPLDRLTVVNYNEVNSY